MGRFLAIVLELFSKRAVSSALLGAGLGLGSTAFIMGFVTYYLNMGLNNVGSVPDAVLGLAALSGFDKAISIIIGAVIFRATVTNMSLKLIKK